MKKLIALSTTALMILSYTVPASARISIDSGIGLFNDQSQFDKRRKPRVPGSSGCDDPRDLIEHPECRG